MNQNQNAGKTGKGFYAALSLSIAMVGAACWYAYSHSSRQIPRKPESSVGQTVTDTTTTSAESTSLTAATTSTTVVTVLTVTDPAEEAAALIRHTTAAQTTPTETASTTARAETPLMPVDGEVLQPFSNGELVKSRTTGIWQTHNGTDFCGAPGTEVVCVLDGTVTEIRRDALWGVCVTVLHDDGTVTRYCGLNEGLAVMAGQVLERGDVIGAIGDTAEAEGLLEPHLHFEVLRNDAYLDPEAFLSGVTVTGSAAQ